MKRYSLLFVLFSVFAFSFLAMSQASADSDSNSNCTFTRNLTIGAINDPATNDVANLQDFLVATGFLTVSSGDIFDEALQEALASYQSARGITPAAGYFGKKSRPIIAEECISVVGQNSQDAQNERYELVTSTSGTGSGNVVGSGMYNKGALVTLEALPNEGSKFSGWNKGRAYGKSPKYSFIINEDQVANAVFNTKNANDAITNDNTNAEDQKVDITSVGEGTILQGALDYRIGTSMTIKAVPGYGYSFDKWEGGQCDGQNDFCTLTINGPVTEKAIFIENDAYKNTSSDNTTYKFTAETTSSDGSGSGNIVGASDSYQAGASVVITAVADPGSRFSRWSTTGQCNRQGPICTFVIRQDTTEEAVFEVGSGTSPGTNPGTTVTYNLDVTKAGAAASYGSVTSNMGVNAEGRTSYAAGSLVTLTVTISDTNKAKFAGWNDGNVCSGRSMTCTFRINGNETAKANFDLIQPATSMFSSPSAIYAAIKSALNLQKGSVQSGVAALQRYLNTKGYIVNETPGAAGSPGNESTYFGEKTEQAVVKFQQDNGLPATGVVGLQTKEVMKAK